MTATSEAAVTSGAGDYADVVNTVHRHFAALDNRDWSALRGLVTDTITLDLGPFGNDGPKAADDYVKLNSTLLTPTEFTQHNICNEIVVLDGDDARVGYYEIAVLRHSALSEDPAVNSWTFYARGEMGLRRTEQGWKIATSRVRRVHDSGNSNLRSDVAQSQA